jgi:hypothetical protein
MSSPLPPQSAPFPAPTQASLAAPFAVSLVFSLCISPVSPSSGSPVAGAIPSNPSTAGINYARMGWAAVLTPVSPESQDYNLWGLLWGSDRLETNLLIIAPANSSALVGQTLGCLGGLPDGLDNWLLSSFASGLSHLTL